MGDADSGNGSREAGKKGKQQVTEEKDPGEDRWRPGEGNGIDVYRGSQSGLPPGMSVPRQLPQGAAAPAPGSLRGPGRHTPVTGARRPMGSRGEPQPRAPANQRRAGSAANGRCPGRPGPRNPGKRLLALTLPTPAPAPRTGRSGRGVRGAGLESPAGGRGWTRGSWAGRFGAAPLAGQGRPSLRLLPGSVPNCGSAPCWAPAPR